MSQAEFHVGKLHTLTVETNASVERPNRVGRRTGCDVVAVREHLDGSVAHQAHHQHIARCDGMLRREDRGALLYNLKGAKAIPWLAEDPTLDVSITDARLLKPGCHKPTDSELHRGVCAPEGELPLLALLDGGVAVPHGVAPVPAVTIICTGFFRSTSAVRDGTVHTVIAAGSVHHQAARWRRGR